MTMPLLQWRGSSIPLRGFSMREDVPWRGEHFQSFFAPHRAIVKMCFYKNKGPGKRPTFRRGHFRCSFSLKKCLRLFLPRGTFAFVRKNILGAHLLVLRGGVIERKFQTRWEYVLPRLNPPLSGD